MNQTTPADQLLKQKMQAEEEVIENPLYQLRRQCPEFAWDWHEFLFRQAVREHTHGEANSIYTSMLMSFNKYKENVYGKKAMLRLNIHLGRILQAVFHIQDPYAFFSGTAEETEQAVKDTAQRIIEAYEKEYERQSKSGIHAA